MMTPSASPSPGDRQRPPLDIVGQDPTGRPRRKPFAAFDSGAFAAQAHRGCLVCPAPAARRREWVCAAARPFHRWCRCAGGGAAECDSADRVRPVPSPRWATVGIGRSRVALPRSPSDRDDGYVRPFVVAGIAAGPPRRPGATSQSRDSAGSSLVTFRAARSSFSRCQAR